MNDYCEDIQDKIAAMITGDLLQEDAKVVEEHVNECSACRGYMQALQEDSDLLAGYTKSLGQTVTRLEDKVIGELGRHVGPEANRWMLIRGAIMKSRISKYAAVAAVLIIAVFGLWPEGGVNGKVYAITDVPALLRSAKILHIQSWRYFPGKVGPDGKEIPRVPTERWLDMENGRMRYSTIGTSSQGDGVTTVNKGEAISDGQYKMILDHTRKRAIFYKLNSYQRMLDTHHNFINTYTQMFGNVAYLDSFQRIGQEKIGGIDYDIWEGEISHPGMSKSMDSLYKCWLSPRTGDLGRLEVWTRSKEGDWVLWVESTKIERLENAPAEIFNTDPPEGYTLANTKETAIESELNTGGSMGCGRLKLDPRISFTLSDGSVILGWHSKDKKTADTQGTLFAELESGGSLPKLPVEIYALKPYGVNNDITYVGRHLVHTHINDKYIEWAIYVPDGIPPALNKMMGYSTLTRFNPEEHGDRCKMACTLDSNIIIETVEAFDTWVGGAMAELSDDGQVPEGITYDAVLQLADKIRGSFDN